MDENELKLVIKVFFEFASPTIVALRKGGSLAAQRKAIAPKLKKYEAVKGEYWENENEDFEGKNLHVQRYHFLVNLKPVDFAFIHTKDKKDVGLELLFNGGKDNLTLQTWTGTYEDVYLNGVYEAFGSSGYDFGSDKVLCSIRATSHWHPKVLQDELQKKYKAHFCNYLESGKQLVGSARHTQPMFLINEYSFIGLVARKASDQAKVNSVLIKKSEDWLYNLKMKIITQQDRYRENLLGLAGSIFFVIFILWVFTGFWGLF